MSLEISVKMNLSADFHIDIDDVERATDESPYFYSCIYDSIADSREFYQDYVLPAFVDILCRKPEEVEFETIGDGCGGHNVYLTGLDWHKFVDQKLVNEMQADELRERIKEAINDDEYETAIELTKQLAKKEA